MSSCMEGTYSSGVQQACNSPPALGLHERGVLLSVSCLFVLFCLDRVLLCRSEEHTSELQSPCNLVCRLLLEKKKIIIIKTSLTHQTNCFSPRHHIAHQLLSDLTFACYNLSIYEVILRTEMSRMIKLVVMYTS